MPLEVKTLSRLPKNLKSQSSSVWIPRILWALEYAKINHIGTISAARISRILINEGGMDVPDTNVARAFREFKGKSHIEIYFTRIGKCYSITSEGSRYILSLIKSEYDGCE